MSKKHSITMVNVKKHSCNKVNIYIKNDITMVNVKKHGTIMVKVNNSITKIND